MKKTIKKKKRLNLKVGDFVKVITGQEKGKIGTIKSLNKKTSKIIVEGINIKVKHIQPKDPEEDGEIRSLEFPIHSSNVLKYKE